MPIPALNEEGFLPPGVHECTLEELQQRFGTFQGSDWRQRLFARLESLIDSVRRSELFCAVVVNGSFVTRKQQPNDVDLVLVLKSGHDFLAEVTPDQYNLLHTQAVRRRFGIDSFLAEKGTDDYVDTVEFFQRCEAPGWQERHPSGELVIENIEQLLQTLEQMGRMQRLVESYRAKTLPQSARNFLLYASGPLEQMRQLQEQINEFLTSRRDETAPETAALRENPESK